jgi:hypothetical protein
MLLFGLIGISVPGCSSAGDAGGWSFTLQPYLWAPTIEADLRFPAPDGSNGEPEFKVVPDDYFENVDIAAILTATARKGKWSFTADFIYMDVSSEDNKLKNVNFGGPMVSTTIDADVDVDVESFITSFGVGYINGDNGTSAEGGPLGTPNEVAFFNGIKQAPIEGPSFAYTFDAANAKAPSQHTTQYFEMMGQWALYHEGWLLSTKVNRAPWEAFGPANPDPLNNQELELYDLSTDFSQSRNIAAQHPDRVQELKKVFIAEAEKYQVFPMDASVAARVIAPRPNITAGRKEFVYTRPMIGLPQGDSPLLLNTSYTITADIEVPKGGAEGMILTSGGRFAGYGFYLLEGKPVFLWNLIDLERIKWQGADALAPGRHTIEFDFDYEGLGVGTRFTTT